MKIRKRRIRRWLFTLLFLFLTLALFLVIFRKLHAPSTVENGAIAVDLLLWGLYTFFYICQMKKPLSQDPPAMILSMKRTRSNSWRYWIRFCPMRIF